MCGLVDAIDQVAEPAGAHVMTLALDWPHRSVRLAALTRLAERAGVEAAYVRGSTDSDERIRMWAESTRAVALRSADAGDQQALF